ncbi:MAG: hypothetical protein Roseis2KO_46630 [Roseivirga sp.]
MKSALFIILISYPLALTAQDEDKSLYVFIGEKIEVTKFTPDVSPKDSSATLIIMDNAFKARYKVIDWVHNRIDTDTIEFEAYDHYGTPGFSHYQHVLLYLVKEEGKLYHAKYQYNALFKTKEGRWASPWTNYDYAHPYNEKTSIKPVKIDFVSRASIDISKYTQKQIKESFPKSYYIRSGNQVMPTYGNYIEELFKLKREGVLKARGYFN